ncbi:MAG: purine-nucleoside phosphorylase [Planctomycetes bacterium]|nr:purine-nucleoside phosphorylase [Planctomycetota bacterium]
MLTRTEIEAVRQRARDAAQTIIGRSGLRPRVAMFLGTGHSEFVRQLTDSTTVRASDIPEFPSGVESSTMIVGNYNDLPVIVADAPLAPYLGVTGLELAFPVRVFRQMGAEILVMTAGAAALRPGVVPGSIGIVEDHLNFTTLNPLVGHNDELLGPRFPDMSEPYDPTLRQIVREIADDAGFPLVEGVFAAIQGPSLPTRAEYRHLRNTGADFVGMSTVPEVLAAVHAGFRTVALLAITQYVDPVAPEPTDLESMVDAADLAAPRVSSILSGFLDRVGKS